MVGREAYTVIFQVPVEVNRVGLWREVDEVRVRGRGRVIEKSGMGETVSETVLFKHVLGRVFE